MRIISADLRDGYAVLTGQDDRLGLVTEAAAVLDDDGVWSFIHPADKFSGDGQQARAERLAAGQERASGGYRVRPADWQRA